MSGDTNRVLPPQPERTCATCVYLEQTQRGQGNRQSFTSYCTKYGTNAHEERGPMGACGPNGASWQPLGTDPGQTYTRAQPTAPEVIGAPMTASAQTLSVAVPATPTVPGA